MKIIKPSYEILTPLNEIEIYQRIEKAARTCYKSEDKITNDGESAKKLIKNLMNRKHLAMIEHGGMISVKFICDRGVSHELVRHRIASFAQESTRYCNYSNDKFGSELTFIKPLFWKEEYVEYKIWENAMSNIELWYMDLLKHNISPQQARSVLPNSLKTEIIVTTNLREWLTIFELRDSEAAHPQMVELMKPLHEEFKKKLPLIFI